MQWFKTNLPAFMAVVMAMAAVAQTVSEKPNVDVRRVGARIACQCGCTDSVATCSMLECHFSKPAKERIAQMQAAGKNDATIIQAFVKDNGPGIYLAPPNALGWIVPYSLALIGLVGICLFLWKYRKPKKIVTVAGEIELEDPALAKYQDQIDKNLANLE